MNVQTIGGGEGAVVVNGTNQPSAPRPGSVDALVDAAVEALADEKPQNDGAGKKVRRDREAERAAEPGDEVQPEGAVEEAPEEQEEEAQAQPEDEGAQEEHSRGSKEEPFGVKDLPDDKYIELKVDGEKVVVPLSELASGYIREQTFTRWANKTRLMAQEAQGMIEQARETRDRVKKELGSFLYDPNEVFEFYMADERREKVLEAAARRYAELRAYHRQRPEERLAWLRQRDEQRLAAERERWESERRSAEEQKQQQERFERAKAILQPGWEAGLRKAGFPEITPALKEEVLLRCQRKEASGEPLTSEDVADFVVRSAKLLELPPRGGKKRPGPAPAGRPRPANDNARPRDEDGRWKAMPQHKRIKDPDWYLRGLKARDLR